MRDGGVENPFLSAPAEKEEVETFPLAASGLSCRYRSLVLLRSTSEPGFGVGQVIQDLGRELQIYEKKLKWESLLRVEVVCMKSIASGDYRWGKDWFDHQALRFTIVLSASMLLMSTENSWSQCAPATGQLILNGASCSETGATRSLDLPTSAAPVIDVTNGGNYSGTSVNLSNGTGHDGHGLSVVGVGSVAHLFDSTIITTGSGYGYGVNIADGASFTAEDLEVTTTADDSDAISMRGAGATAILNGARLETAGRTAEGIQAENGASFTGTGVEIITLAAGADAYANGVFLGTGSTGQLTDSSITTAGRLSAGIWASSSSNFTGTRLDIETSGPESEGVFVDGASSVILVESSVTTSGANAAGTSAFGAGSSINFNRGAISASGQNANAVVVVNGGSQILSDVDASASGDGGSAIFVENTSGTDRGLVTVNGGSLSSVAGPLIRADAGHGEITLNGPVSVSPGISGGRNVLADVFNGSDLDLSFNSVSDVTGDVDVSGAATILDVSFDTSDWTGNLLASGGVANLSLVGSTWTGRSAGATSIAVDDASVWNVSASSNSGSISNAGLISFVTGDTSSALLAGSYDGQNGLLGINTVLGADDSATNRLIINGGSATGSTGLVVRNAGGAGALTTGEGIRVVETQGGAATDTNAFYLTSRTAAGAYEYLLFRGGDSSTQDWFLRSHLVVPEIPEVPEVPETPDTEVPLYRPEVPLYAPVPAIGRELGLAFLGTLHERVGEQMNIKVQPDQENYVNGAWLRILGEFGRNKWTGSADVQIRDARLWGIQAGLDLYRAEHSNGHRDHIGIYGGYATHRSRVSGFALGVDDLQVGKIELDGPAVGAYWTHYTPSGGYLDGVVQWNWMKADAHSDFGTRMSTRGTGFTASLEAGQPFMIADGWQLEPQAQIIYQTVSFRDSYDAVSTLSWDEDGAITGRLGVRLQYTSKDGERVWQPYIKANLWHSFSGTDHTTFGATTRDTRFGGTSLEVGAGMTARLTDTFSLYGHVDHRWSISDGGRGSATGGAIGLRVNW